MTVASLKALMRIDCSNSDSVATSQRVSHRAIVLCSVADYEEPMVIQEVTERHRLGLSLVSVPATVYIVSCSRAGWGNLMPSLSLAV